MSCSLTPEVYLRIRSFLRHLESACNSCVRKHLSCCESCDANTAKILGKCLDNSCASPRKAIDYSLASRMEAILNQLRKANRPLRSIDIDIRDYCSKELKLWTLGKLISLGKVKSEKQGYFRVYSLVGEKTKRKN